MMEHISLQEVLGGQLNYHERIFREELEQWIYGDLGKSNLLLGFLRKCLKSLYLTIIYQ